MPRKAAILGTVVAVMAAPLTFYAWNANRPPKIYVFPEAAFSIAIPASWQEADTNGDPAWPGIFVRGWHSPRGLFGGSAREIAVVVVEPASAKTSPDSAFESGVATLRASPGFVEHARGEIPVGNTPAKYIVYSRAGGSLKHMSTFALANGRIITITCSTAMSNYEQAETRFRKIVSTLTINGL